MKFGYSIEQLAESLQVPVHFVEKIILIREETKPVV